MKVCILAGGSGTRLWPYSRPEFPKQFLPLVQGKSLIEATFERALSTARPDEVFVITTSAYVELVQDAALPFGIQQEQILVEPKPKNTAPAIAFALKTLVEQGKLSKQEPFLVLPSDHWVEESFEEWKTLIAIGEKTAAKGYISLYGVPPTRPETGYGYIQIGKEKGENRFSIHKFTEKPDRITAEKYVQEDNYYWNAGMFLFTYDVFFQELQRHCPDLFYLFSYSSEKLEKDFAKVKPISIDHAIMEKTSIAMLIPFTLRWSDLGSWESIYERSVKDKMGNVVDEGVFSVKSQNCFVQSSDRPICCYGVNDLVVVDTPEGLLIARKGETQEAIKQMHGYLEQNSCQKEKEKTHAVS